MSPQTKVVIITGTVGAGKSAVAARLHHTLGNNGLVSACLDMDYLTDLRPIPLTDPHNTALGFTNLVSLWPNFMAAGATHAVVAAVVENKSDRDNYAAAFATTDLTIVRLTAPARVRYERISKRDPPGPGQRWSLQRTDQLEDILEALDIEDYLVANTTSVKSCAQEVLAKLAW
jgi:predicted kinase